MSFDMKAMQAEAAKVIGASQENFEAFLTSEAVTKAHDIATHDAVRAGTAISGLALAFVMKERFGDKAGVFQTVEGTIAVANAVQGFLVAFDKDQPSMNKWLAGAQAALGVYGAAKAFDKVGTLPQTFTAIGDALQVAAEFGKKQLVTVTQKAGQKLSAN